MNSHIFDISDDDDDHTPLDDEHEEFLFSFLESCKKRKSFFGESVESGDAENGDTSEDPIACSISKPSSKPGSKPSIKPRSRTRTLFPVSL